MNQQNTDYNKMVERYDKLIDSVQDVLDGQLLDDVIPALTALLGGAIIKSGVEKKIAISYVVNSIDAQFKRENK